MRRGFAPLRPPKANARDSACRCCGADTARPVPRLERSRWHAARGGVILSHRSEINEVPGAHRGSTEVAPKPPRRVATELATSVARSISVPPAPLRGRAASLPPIDALYIVASFALVAAAQQPSARRPRPRAQVRNSVPAGHLQFNLAETVHDVEWHATRLSWCHLPGSGFGGQVTGTRGLRLNQCCLSVNLPAVSLEKERPCELCFLPRPLR